MASQTITVTFSECVENHVGMQKIGQLADAGFTNEQLAAVHQHGGLQTELYDLAMGLPEDQREGNTAYLLVIRDGVRQMGADPDRMLQELAAVPHDSKIWSAKHGGVVNKIARHNLCVADEEQPPRLEEKKGTVVSYARLSETSKLRQAIGTYLGTPGLYAETNLYYDPSKCGIGFHGDTERKIVVGARLGAEIPLVYKWYTRSNPVSPPMKFSFKHGDMYVMSEKAGGSDWKRPSILTLRHAAGCTKYTGV